MTRESDNPTFPAAIASAIKAYLAGIHTCRPGVITEYRSGDQRATVQPLIRRGYRDESGDRQVEQLPAISDVPVMFLGGGGGRLTFPVAAGDTGLLFFSEASLDIWLATGNDVDPLDDRRHTLTDAVFLPGLYDFANAPSASGSAVVLSGPDVRLGSQNASSFVALANLVLTELTKIATALTTHVHAGVTPGAGVSGVAASAYAPASVAAVKVKAE